jgi:hypothetical protein
MLWIFQQHGASMPPSPLIIIKSHTMITNYTLIEQTDNITNEGQHKESVWAKDTRVYFLGIRIFRELKKNVFHGNDDKTQPPSPPVGFHKKGDGKDDNQKKT